MLESGKKAPRPFYITWVLWLLAEEVPSSTLEGLGLLACLKIW
jgi:hypothetical protein